MQTKGRGKQRSGTPEGKNVLDATGIGTPNLGARPLVLVIQRVTVVVGSEEQ